MTGIQLKNVTKHGVPLEATYLPEKGMNLSSFKMGDTQLIDLSTKEEFEARFAGLGALIGPHFHNRNPAVIPPIKDESLFPHIAKIHAENRPDPFSHGIGRYAPWNYEATETKIKAHLSGKDTWNGVPLADLEGQNFQMTFEVELTTTGLQLNLSVTSDTDSLIGIHHYWRLPSGKGTIKSQVQNSYIVNNEIHTIPEAWINSEYQMTYPLDQDTDFTFHPFPNPREGKILLETEEYQLLTTYACVSQENSWQLYHPKGASFVCIEPISAKDPRHANLSVSGIAIHLEPLSPKKS